MRIDRCELGGVTRELEIAVLVCIPLVHFIVRVRTEVVVNELYAYVRCRASPAHQISLYLVRLKPGMLFRNDRGGRRCFAEKKTKNQKKQEEELTDEKAE